MAARGPGGGPGGGREWVRRPLGSQTEGASTSNFLIDVVVQGIPPDGSTITVRAPNNETEVYPFPLARTTITLPFGTCDGQPVTTFLADVIRGARAEIA